MAQIIAARRLAALLKSTHRSQLLPVSANISYSVSHWKQENPKEEINNEPIKYFGSQASRWTAQRSREGPKGQDMPWFQPYVVNFSVAIFLIYFCVLREENDIDEGLGRSLFEHVPGLEEKQLIVSYHYHKENGLSTLDIENRMKELGMNFGSAN
ncbi:uncharacterized protein LOC128304416 [Anopheles moucheti]|uniref:uncharacterized protein LOC128304416 n=1 Tax=Anopheles moucheti TaxID=186751 RepID=UPI0022F01AF6|nr:uncharacterized protein LOC128304416 [Anopheles moucheti]